MTPRKIAIITPGGDSSGINACIRAIVRQGIHNRFEIFGIRRGYQGLIEGDIVRLNARSVSGIIHRGGTMLKSTRCETTKNPAGIKAAADKLNEYTINSLIIIGGDGSLRAGFKLSRTGIGVIGIPATIDNDVYGTDETIGFDTAVDVAIDAVDKIRDTASSFDRIFLIQVMGREHGFLALSVGVASGAEYILIPEIPYDLDKLCMGLREAKIKGKTSGIIIVAEGAGDVFEIAKKIQHKTGMPTRASSLGYIQRGGAPSGRSRILGSLFGSYAIELAKKRAENSLIVIKNNRVGHIPLRMALKKYKAIDKGLYNLARRLSGQGN